MEQLSGQEVANSMDRVIPFGGALMATVMARNPSLASLTPTTAPKNTAKATVDGRNYDTMRDQAFESDAIHD